MKDFWIELVTNVLLVGTATAIFIAAYNFFTVVESLFKKTGKNEAKRTSDIRDHINS